MSVETPPAAAVTPAPKPTTNNDPFLARILADMGKAVSDGQVIDAPPKAPEAPRNVLDGEFISMGEAARFKKEREEAKTEAKPEEKAEEKAAEGEAKKEEPAAKEEKKAEEPAASATPAPSAKPKVVVEKAKPIEEIVEGVVRKLSQEQKPASAAAPAAPKKEESVPDPDADFVAGLDEEQKEVVELARYAAKAMPDKYGQMAKKTVEYLKKVDSYIDSKRKEDPDWDPENDTGFSEFIEENRPTYQPGDRKKLERQQITDETRASVLAELNPKIEETERTARVTEIKPEIDKAAQSYVSAVAQRFAPDDKSPFAGVLKVAAEKGWTDEAWTEAKAVDPIAAAAAQNFMGQASVLGREYLELVSGVSQQKPYNPQEPPNSPSNQKAIAQQRLFEFIDQQEQIFLRDAPEDMRVIKGKTFVTRRELSQMPPAEQAKHWTLGHDDVLDMLAVAASTRAQEALTAQLKRLEEAGYVRNGKHPAPKKEAATTAAATKKEESPKTTVTPSPGAGKLPDPPRSPTVFTEEELKRQWSGGANSWPG